MTAAEIKFIRSLSDRKARIKNGLFIVEGEKMVAEALESSLTVEKVFRREEIGEQAMSRISLLSSPSPALALVQIPKTISQVSPLNEGGLYLYLDSLRDPGNMGTILRTADWFGVDAVAASPDSVDIFNPKVVQSTMGSLFRVRFHYCSLPELIGNADAAVYGTFLHDEDIYSSALSEGDLRPRIVVTGNEANGISESNASLCTRRLTIPSFAYGRGPESLNAAVATAICLSEFRRR